MIRIKNKDLSLLLAGQLVSQVGDKFHMIAISFWVLETTGSSSKMGIVLAASLIPSLILGLFSGAFIDRYDRKKIIVATDLLRGVALLLFSFLFYQGIQSLSVIIVVQIILSANTAFFDPAIPSIIPQIVPEKDLARANSKHQLINGFSTIFGALFAGICISKFGYISIFFTNAISFLFSAFFESYIRIPKYPPQKTSLSPNLINEISNGYRYIFSRSNLLILLFLVMLIHFFVGANEIFMPLIANSQFSDGPKMLGFFQGAFGAGVVLTSIALSVSKVSEYEKKLLFISISIIGLLYVAIPHLGAMSGHTSISYLSIFFIFGACLISAYISFKTLIQKSIHNEFSGRVFAIASTIGNGSIPAAMIVYGFLFENFPIHGILIVSGAILIVLSIVSYFIYHKKISLTIKTVRNASAKS